MCDGTATAPIVLHPCIAVAVVGPNVPADGGFVGLEAHRVGECGDCGAIGYRNGQSVFDDKVSVCGCRNDVVCSGVVPYC